MTAPTTYVLGLVGEGIGRSLTPAMHEAEARAQGLALAYRRIDTAALGTTSPGIAPDVAEILAWARRLGFDGLNVTHPFKRDAVACVDELSEAAEALGAVNTVVFRDGRVVGDNTDWSGYGRAFRAVLPDAVADPVVLLGAGGAGLAVGYALLDQGACHVAVYDADAERADATVVRLAKRFGDDRVDAVCDVEVALREARGLVNATPVGMHGHDGVPLQPELVEERLWVSDVVYFPLETPLLALARRRGCRVIPGGGMAVEQAVDAFALFTGRAADADRMRRHFLELNR